MPPTQKLRYVNNDAKLLCKTNNLLSLQTNLNNKRAKVYEWLCVNKLSLNIDKSNFVIFHSKQRRTDTNVQIIINEQQLKQEDSIKYLGIMLDSALNWKGHSSFIVKKIKRSIGILSKLRHYINLNTIKTFNYALIYPFLTCGILAGGNAYPTILQPLLFYKRKQSSKKRTPVFDTLFSDQ